MEEREVLVRTIAKNPITLRDGVGLKPGREGKQSGVGIARAVVKNEGVGLLQGVQENRDIRTTHTIGRLPSALAVLVRTTELDVVDGKLLAAVDLHFLGPDRHFD